MIITRTPLRISLVGGGTDMPQFYEHHTGGVVSFAIDKYVYVSLNKKFDDKIRVSYSKTEIVDALDDLQHDIVRETLREWKVQGGYEITSISDIPGEGSGLGSSSAFTVGLVNALGRGGHPAILAERAFIVESEKCHHPVGKQDHYASAYGGMNYLVFRKKSVDVKTLYPYMERDFLLLYTGVTRSANTILKEQAKRFSKGDTMKHGQELASLAYKFWKTWTTTSMDAEGIGWYLNAGWNLKKELSSVSNPQIDKWYSIGMKNGAFGGKLLGAGGGGFMLFAAPYKKHAQIAEATGLRKIDFKIVNTGSEVIYNDNR